MPDPAPTAIGAALGELSRALAALDLGLEVPEAEPARRLRAELIGQIDDYLLPRLRNMDAPLLMVVGGSTGAGKSTLVNSLVGAPVTPSGVLRPTTRAPVLVCNPADVRWFEGERVLPGMPRTVGGTAPPGGLQVAPTAALPEGLALLDSPDIDSVVETNRELARKLLAAADAWLFVTTAARYADAVPWDLLHAARDRGTSLRVVLDRVAPESIDEVASHLRQMLSEHGLGGQELLVLPETTLADGMVPPAVLAPVRGWLDGLAADAQAGASVVAHTLEGALDSLPARVGIVERALAEQQAAAAELRADVQRAYAQALDEVDTAVKGGTLLRGEVLARWHEVVGTGDIMRAMETRIGWLRDRVRSLVTGGPPADAELKAAVGSSVDALVHAAADRAAERAAGSWRQRPPGRVLLEGRARMDAASSELQERTREAVREWQGFVFELVRDEGASKRTTARLASLGVNGAGLTVMLAVFVQTGGLTGAEVAVAGGTSAVGQKVLEAIFGDQAVRTLAARAREDLIARVDRLLDLEGARYLGLIDPLAPPPGAGERLRGALADLKRAR